MQNALRDRVAPAKIIKEPAVELRGSQIRLNGCDVGSHLTRGADFSSLVNQQTNHLLWRHAAQLDAFRAASFTGEDSNSRSRDFQNSRQKFDQRLIRPVVYRWRLQPHPQRAFPFAGNVIAARSRLY